MNWATAVAPKFSDILTLFQPGGQILPTFGTITPKFSPWLGPCVVSTRATGTTAVAPKFLGTLTLFQTEGDRFCPPWLRPGWVFQKLSNIF